MSRAQILVKSGNRLFEFSKSKTGQLDYEGLWQNERIPDVEGYQALVSSSYFSPAWYAFLQDAVNNTPEILIFPDTDVSDKDVFAYLTHVGALLSAVEAKDSLLAGELYLRRKNVFEKFAQLTQFILEPLSVEIIFSLCYGRSDSLDAEDIPLIFNSARKKLNYDSSKETLEQAFMRYFKGKNVTLTVPVVGSGFHKWEGYSDILENLTEHIDPKDILGGAEKVRKAKHDFYDSLKTVVQAEPYNPVDKNAITVFIEDIDSKIAGNPGLEKAGYVRVLAAKVIREAKPEKVAFNGKLVRLSSRDIVVQITV